jgi:hypothetical protein
MSKTEPLTYDARAEIYTRNRTDMTPAQVRRLTKKRNKAKGKDSK